jgi:TonB family protein
MGGGRRWGRAGLLALAIHLLVVVIGAVVIKRFGGAARTDVGEVESVAVSTLDDATARQITAEIERMQEQARAEETRKEREAIEPPGQVVEVPRPREPERPRRARFVSEHDSTVEKETKKEGHGPEPARAPGLLAMRTPAERSERPSREAAPATEREAAPPARPVPPVASAPERERREAPPRDPDGALEAAPASPAEPMAPPAEAPRAEAPGGAQMRSLLPNNVQLAQALAAAGTEDHLDDIEDGNETALNTKSWKFASFFNRVKRQVAEHWRPGAEYERRDPTGQIYGSGSWVTFLRIVLKPDGALASVGIQQTSGLEFLDDAAVEAVKRGQPYPNPPSQLVDEHSGVISFKFGFYFDVGGGPRMKIYRYPQL